MYRFVTAFFSMSVGLLIAVPSSWATELSLEDAKVRFVISLDHGTGVRLTQLYDKRRNINAINPNVNSRLFDLNLEDSVGKRVRLYGNLNFGRAVVLEHRDNRLLLRQAGNINGKALSVDVSIRLVEGRIYVRYAVTPPTSYTLRSIVALPVFLGPLGVSGNDDLLHYPYGSGLVKKAPYDKPASYHSGYPGGLQTYQMMGLYDQDIGIYYAAHDPVGLHKALGFRSSENSGVGFYNEVFATDIGRMANQQSVEFDTVLGLVEGDWYDAAQVYRDFIKAESNWWPNRNLDYWRARPGLHDASFWLIIGSEPTTATNIAEKYRAYMNVPIGAHWYTWYPWKMDDNYPVYFPPRNGFAEAVSHMQSIGISVMPYINARLWDIDIESYDEQAKACAVKQQDRSVLLNPSTADITFAVMCPSAPYWQQTMTRVVTRLAQDYKVDGVYLDQISASTPSLCFDPTHAHAAGGGSHWVAGYQTMLKQMQRALLPGQYLTSEMNAEPFLGQVDAYLNWWWTFNDQQPIFQAIYVGQYQSFGRAHRGGPTEHRSIVMKTGQQIVFGEQIGWFSGDPLLAEPKAMEFVRDAAQARYQY